MNAVCILIGLILVLRGRSMIFYTLVKHVVRAFLGESGGIPRGKCLKFGSLKWHFPHSDSTLEQNFKNI